MSISAPFIERPIATSLVAAAMLIAGGAAFAELPVAPLPRVDFPTISVSAGLPGASPETMASSVATPLERRLGRIAGLTEMTSSSSLGSTTVTMQFDVDRDVESAARDVQASIGAAGGELPPGMPTLPTYRKVNPSDAPILIVALTSPTLTTAQIFDTANSVIAQKIAQLPGVGQVTVGGGQQPAVRIQADPLALAAKGLSFDDIRIAVAAQTADSPKGAVSDAQQTQILAANDQRFNAEDWRNTVVARDGAAVVHLFDVAKVIDSVENERVAGWTDLKRSVTIVVRRQPGANILEVIAGVKRMLPELAKMIPPGIDMQVALDRSQTIRSSVHDVEFSLVLSVLLVVLVVFAFLRSVRATVIPSVAVPLSLVATFGVMYLVGYSLDNLSLMALTISTGFVVDDAIVVTENVARFVEAGVPPLEAARKGAKQISFTILSITASLLAVFIPILFMGGIVGRLLREFAVTLAVAITLSGLISLTITPAMCARLLVHKGTEKVSWLSERLERAYTALERIYARALRRVLSHRALVGVLMLVIIAFTIVLYVVVPKGLFPQQDTGLVMGTTSAPQDISFPSMKARQEAILKVLAKDPDIAHVNSSVGGGMGSSNNGNVFIALKPRDERSASADEIIARLRAQLSSVPGITLFMQSVQDVRVGGRVGLTEYQYTLQSADLATLNEWAPTMVARLRRLPELKDVASDQQTGALALRLEVDRDTASRLGIQMQDIDAALSDAFGQRQIAVSYSLQNAYRTVLELDPSFAQGPNSIDDLYVHGTNGQVPLRALCKTQIVPTALSVGHQSQFAAITIYFNASLGVSLGQAVDAVRKAEQEVGLPASVRAEFAGTAQAFRDSAKTQPYLVLAALVIVYLVLGMLYESYIHPITILSTIPSAGLGALLALLATGTELSVIGLVAIILLIGIVKKNAIMMIDFAIEAERDEELSPEDAIYKACVLRFRPILMTTLAALLGAVPLAIGTGTGSELRRPLGIAIVGGLLVSQLFTLFTTPVTYLFLDRFARDRRPDPAPRPPATGPAAT